MSTNNDELLYDEDDSVKFIQNYLPQELKGKFSNERYQLYRRLDLRLL